MFCFVSLCKPLMSVSHYLPPLLAAFSPRLDFKVDMVMIDLSENSLRNMCSESELSVPCFFDFCIRSLE